MGYVICSEGQFIIVRCSLLLGEYIFNSNKKHGLHCVSKQCLLRVELAVTYLYIQLLAVKGERFPVIGHVRYINILTWLRGFQVKILYLVLFSLYPSLLGIEGQKKLQF